MKNSAARPSMVSGNGKPAGSKVPVMDLESFHFAVIFLQCFCHVLSLIVSVGVSDKRPICLLSINSIIHGQCKLCNNSEICIGFCSKCWVVNLLKLECN